MFRLLPLHLLFIFLFLGTWLVPGGFSDALAQETTSEREYDLPSGPLAATLNRLARQAGLALTIDAASLEGKTSAPVRGRFKAVDAMTRALEGSGLALVKTDVGSYTLRPLPKEALRSAAQGPDTQMPEVTVAAATLAETRAITEGSGSYGSPVVTIGKAGQSLREIPQSVSVITRARMDGQNLVSVEDVLLQAPGITKQNLNYGHSRYYSRGFEVASYQFDGVPVGTYGGLDAPDMAIVDRVEVVRGAPGLLVGNGEPGGTVNFVRKRPLAQNQFLLGASVGSWDFYRTEADISGPLNESGSLRGRLVATYEDRDYFYDVTHATAPLLYGILELDIGADTLLTLGGRRQDVNIEGRWVRGLPRFSNGDDLGVSRSTSLAVPWTRYEAQINEVFGALEHRFSDTWKATVTANHQSNSRFDKTASWFGTVDPVTHGGLAWGSVDHEYVDTGNNAVDAHVEGSFEAFGRKHDLMFGANWQRFIEDIRYGSTAVADPIDIFHYDPTALSEPAAPALFGPDRATDERYGAYASLRMRMTDALAVVLGGRVSWYDLQVKDKATGTVYYAVSQDKEFTPYAGAVYDLDERWSVYASYTDIFAPQSNLLSISGRPLDPVIGSNYEAGVKGALREGTLNASLAVFRIDQENRAQVDPLYPAACPVSPIGDACYLDSGAVRSQGFELEISGALRPDWQVAAGYTFTDTAFLKDADAQGQTFNGANTPRHLLRLWTSYQLPGAWNRLSINGGVSAQSEMFNGNGVVRVEQGAYAVWNAGAAYRISRIWSAAAQVNNVFDETYYAGSIGDIYANNHYGEPRNFMLTLRGKF